MVRTTLVGMKQTGTDDREVMGMEIVAHRIER
jgi:hypothetical protein